MVLWAVLGGLIGARLYHVVTDYQLFEGDWGRTIEIWNGGFAIWGAVMGGAVALWIVCRRRHLSFAEFGDSMVPGIAFAQAIGRWGNYCNQELFGGPSGLPWAVEIDAAHRPAGYEGTATFQPTFLYESLWCLGLAFALLWVDRRYELVRGQLICLYIAGYTAFRLVMEEMRIDPAHTIGPLRVNAWVSIVLVHRLDHALRGARATRRRPSRRRGAGHGGRTRRAVSAAGLRCRARAARPWPAIPPWACRTRAADTGSGGARGRSACTTRCRPAGSGPPSPR